MTSTFDRFCEIFEYTRLNPVQQEAVRCVDGAALLFSVPGSGKTTVIVARTGYMIHACGIDPKRILVITFTRAAAAEMRQRYMARFGNIHSPTPDFRTIHSFCYMMIRKMAQSVGANEPKVIDNNLPIIEGIARDHHCFLEKETIEAIASAISEVKNRMLSQKDLDGISIEDLPAPLSFKDIYIEYKDRLKQNGQMDRDDLLVYANGLMRKYPDLLRRIQARYTYVSVDEAQDTSPLQHRIIDQFCALSGNVFMVGDDDQSIYGFRGADPDELLNFNKRYPDAKQLTMNYNYRSDRIIVDRAERFIRQNEHRAPKHMQAFSDREGMISYPTYTDFNDRTERILSEIKRARADRCSIAVLYRQNVSAFALQYALSREGIAFTLLPGANPVLTNRTVRDVMRILTFARDRANYEKFRDCYSLLNLYLSRSSLEEARSLHADFPQTDILLLLEKKADLRNAPKLRNRNSELREINNMAPLRALETVDGFVSENDRMNTASARLAFSFLKYVARDYRTLPDFMNAINKMDKDPSTPSAEVTLSTLHSCKGLEFDRVMMIDLIQDLIPGRSDIDQKLKKCTIPALREQLQQAEVRRIEEEARLFYVGATRPRHELQFLIAANDVGTLNATSSFVRRYRGDDPAKTNAYPTVPTHTRTEIADRFNGAAFSASGSSARPFAIPFDPADISVGSMVKHHEFGIGTVTRISHERNHIHVLFGSIIKTFSYPEAFTYGFLKKC